jgi:hypothetical protein
MNDRDDYDHDRLRREEDDYRAVTERPPLPLAQVAAQRNAAKSTRKPKETKPCPPS